MINRWKWFFIIRRRGDVSVDAYIVDESLWITQKSMAKLFGIDKSGISRHLNKIFKSGELKKEVVVAKFATTNPHGAMEGKTQENDSMYYNLDAIISVGYRVNSIKATHFRIWATKVLKEYMTKGFVLDDDRFHGMYMIAMKTDDHEKARGILDKLSQLCDLFDMGAYNRISTRLDYYVAVKDASQVLSTMDGVYTIMEVKAGQGSKAGWGRLKSGIGWLSLDFCQRL